MKARIYKPSKSAMQSGRAGCNKWVLEYEAETARHPEALMGWTASGDTNPQVKVKFEDLEKAKEFARRKGIEYVVLPTRERKVKPRNYADNFRYSPPKE